MEGKKVLVTGASGFIGSFLIEGGLKRGMQTWAGIRKTSSRKYLQDKRIRFAELNFGNKQKLKEHLLKLGQIMSVLFKRSQLRLMH